MRSMLSCCIALLGLLALPSTATAQMHVSPHAAFGSDVDFGVGTTLGLPVGPVEAAGSFTYFFPSDFDYWEIDVMALYPIQLSDSPVVPYLVAGLAIGSFSVDVDVPDIPGFDFDTGVDGSQVGMRLGGGARIGTGGSPAPFAEVLLGLGDIPDFMVRGGVSIPLGD